VETDPTIQGLIADCTRGPTPNSGPIFLKTMIRKKFETVKKMTPKDDIEELQADVEELRAANACNCGEKTADEFFEMVDLEKRYI